MPEVRVGPYTLLLPDFWEEPGTVREKAGFFGYNAVAMPGVSFDFYVMIGRAGDPAEREKLVSAFAQGKTPARHVRSEESFQGVVLERHRMGGCSALGPDAVYELALCDAFDDLLLFGFAFTAPLEVEQSLQLLFTTMVIGSIVDRGNVPRAPAPAPAPAKKKSWWPPFGR